ncbi:hypothetical protein [Rufibacter roseus]|uniref:DUF2249 domain-containing protein n=1 Tax=Rufibacter roseus TaxID=1567108 RepID=A0ABW2DNB6_9BACT|nr:hypothetical protein [Rufibacter roseus]
MYAHEALTLAKQAKVLADRKRDEEVKGIYDQISKVALKGEMQLTIYRHLPPHIIIKLKENGFEVKVQSHMNESDTVISWDDYPKEG